MYNQNLFNMMSSIVCLCQSLLNSVQASSSGIDSASSSPVPPLGIMDSSFGEEKGIVFWMSKDDNVKQYPAVLE